MRLRYRTYLPLITVLSMLITSCSTQTSACPAPGVAALPSDPPAYADYPQVMQDFLSQGGRLEVLEQSLIDWFPQKWHAISVESADLTNDGLKEVIVIAQYIVPETDGHSALGQLYIWGCVQGEYRLDYQSAQLNWDTEQSGILTIEDINTSGLADVVFVSGFCGASVCTTNIQVLEWLPAEASFKELLPNNTGMLQAEVSLADENRDGIFEIILNTPGTVSSLSIGPRFAERVTYQWDGKNYYLATHEVGVCGVLCNGVESP